MYSFKSQYFMKYYNISDELAKLSKEGFGKYVDKEEMAKDKVLPPRNCFCAFVKMDINNLDASFFDMVRDKDCCPDVYTTNYDKSIDDNLKKVAITYALDKDKITISPCEDDVDSNYPL